jgi:hypothetical protein
MDDDVFIDVRGRPWPPARISDVVLRDLRQLRSPRGPLPVTEFKISSFCNFGGCVEVGRADDGVVLVRDTKDRAQQALAFTAEEWADFVAGVKAGEFDF